MSKFIILGAGGCFGTNTAKFLLEKNQEVIGIGRGQKKAEPFSLGVDYPYYAYHIHYELDYVMELLDREKPDVIVNYAAQGEGAASFNPKDYWRFYETNTLGLVKLVGALQQRFYPKRFIHIGTSELYGAVTAPSKETDSFQPTSPYAASKAAFDLHLMAVSKVQGFPMNILRPSNAYCPGQQLHRVIPKAVLYGLTGKKLPLHGGGKAEKSYIHADDLSRAIYLTASGAPLGKVYNVGPQKPTSIKEVVERVAGVLGMRFEDLCELAPDRTGQDSRYWLDSSEIQKELDWKPLVNWDEGLAGMVEWGRKYVGQLRDEPYRMRA